MQMKSSDCNRCVPTVYIGRHAFMFFFNCFELSMLFYACFGADNGCECTTDQFQLH